MRLNKELWHIRPQLEEALRDASAGHFADAAEKLRLLLSQNLSKSDAAMVQGFLGAVYAAMDDHQAALREFEKAAVENTTDATLFCNLCNCLNEVGRFDDAVVAGRKALAISPDYVEALNNLGNALNKLGKHDEAIASYTKALQLDPDHVEAQGNLGAALNALGKHDEAIACYAKALQINPDYVEAHCNLGIVLRQLDRHDEAIASYTRALQIKPDSVEAHANLGAVFDDLGRHDEAVACYTRALEIKPDHALSYFNMGISFDNVCDHEAAIANYTRAVEIDPRHAAAHSNRNIAVNYLADWSTEDIFQTHLEFEKAFGGQGIRTAHGAPARKGAGDRLKIGYVSADFREHSVAYFFEPLLRAHDTGAVEIFCYYNYADEDHATRRIRQQAEHWRPIEGMSDDAVVDLIKRDGIDILVDLGGHTRKNRLLVFARKPAPVQVSWLGYPNTTGLRAMDYRFTDPVADPAGDADSFHTEKLIRLPNGFHCYRGDETVSVQTDLPFDRRRHITFGSFNNLSKVTPRVIQIWARILRGVPTSRLMLKSKQLDDPSVRSRFLNLFETNGVTEDRIDLLAYRATSKDHRRLYDAIDICLDPFPYNGTTTTCEALWMGAPVIALRGDRHAGRVGASLLTIVGLEDFIAQDVDDYVDRAVRSAENPAYLRDIRLGLRERLQKSALCDHQGFARTIERSYQRMWDDYCRQR